MTATTSSLDIRLDLKPEADRGRCPDDASSLGFGSKFTDHMFCIDWREGQWQDARIVPFADVPLSPAALVLHYSQTVFEGLKAFGGPDDSAILFRPDQNAQRMYNSCERMCIPPLPVESFLEAVQTLVDVERAWIPRFPGTALYVRPTCIATEGVLGVRPAKEYLWFVILSPVGSYFAAGFKPVDLLVADKYVRASEGGVGEAKTGGNYAASLLAGKEAAAEGFSQVLWLDAKEHKYVEEVGAMNVMFAFEGKKLVTPALTGSILPGVTRKSVIELARDLGYTVEERALAIDEVIDGLRSGQLKEVFGTGTAAAIAPVGKLRYKGEDFVINDHAVGPIAEEMYKALQDIQYGRVEDTRGWTVRV